VKVWTVIAIAAVIWALGMITGAFSTRMLIGILFFVLIGAVYPPFGIGVGSIVILYLMLVKGQNVLSWITSKLGGKANG
jgi:hypothetical protein